MIEINVLAVLLGWLTGLVSVTAGYVVGYIHGRYKDKEVESSGSTERG